jgi:hypothetical protein
MVFALVFVLLSQGLSLYWSLVPVSRINYLSYSTTILLGSIVSNSNDNVDILTSFLKSRAPSYAHLWLLKAMRSRGRIKGFDQGDSYPTDSVFLLQQILTSFSLLRNTNSNLVITHHFNTSKRQIKICSFSLFHIKPSWKVNHSI